MYHNLIRTDFILAFTIYTLARVCVQDVMTLERICNGLKRLCKLVSFFLNVDQLLHQIGNLAARILLSEVVNKLFQVCNALLRALTRHALTSPIELSLLEPPRINAIGGTSVATGTSTGNSVGGAGEG
jgi:methylmalonyl-CoA mutase N-terminal domain/subunit